jgi:hypothetical protein
MGMEEEEFDIFEVWQEVFFEFEHGKACGESGRFVHAREFEDFASRKESGCISDEGPSDIDAAIADLSEEVLRFSSKCHGGVYGEGELSKRFFGEVIAEGFEQFCLQDVRGAQEVVYGEGLFIFV